MLSAREKPARRASFQILLCTERALKQKWGVDEVVSCEVAENDVPAQDGTPDIDGGNKAQNKSHENGDNTTSKDDSISNEDKRAISQPHQPNTPERRSPNVYALQTREKTVLGNRANLTQGLKG